jgi:ubiquinone biosynthesis protein COQ9
MKKAAGVSDIEEVVRRFETQEETAKHLQELQVTEQPPLEAVFKLEDSHMLEDSLCTYSLRPATDFENIFAKKLEK